MVQLLEEILAEKSPSEVYDFLFQNSQDFRQFVSEQKDKYDTSMTRKMKE